MNRSDPRNRRSRFFKRLSPPPSAKINRDASAYNFTWPWRNHFLLFIVLPFTGVLLMFYYHRPRCRRFATFSISSTIAFGKLLRNMHRGAASLMVITTGCTCSGGAPPGSYKNPRIQLGVWRCPVSADPPVVFYRYLLPDDQLDSGQ